MFEFAEIFAFLLATVVLNLTPGSDVLFVATQSIGRGLKGAIPATLGISFGCLFHIFAVAFGLAELLNYYPLAFLAVKLVGAGYLFLLAYQALKSKGLALDDVQGSNLSSHRTFLKGALTNILNPKVALFFLAFLPQFIHAERGSVMVQALILGGIFVTSVTVVNFGYAILFCYARDYLKKSQSFQRYLGRVTAGVFGFLAVKLMLAESKS